MKANAFMLVEVISLLVLIVLSAIIYMRLRVIVRLTSHKGVVFFQRAFLFFMISFALSLFLFMQRIMQTMIFDMRLGMFLGLYTSLVAMGYLCLSLHAERLEVYEWMMLTAAMCIPFLGAGFASSPLVALLVLQAVVIVVALIMILLHIKHHKKVQFDTLLLYILLLVFWVMSGIGVFISRFLEIDRLYIPLLKVIVFGYIFYKIQRRFLTQ